MSEQSGSEDRDLERENMFITAELDEKMAARMLKYAEPSPEVRQTLIDAGKARILAPVFGHQKTPKKPPAHLYLIQAGNDGPIKIGAASNIGQRMATMQTGSHETLHLVGHVEDGASQERALHCRASRFLAEVACCPSDQPGV